MTSFLRVEPSSVFRAVFLLCCWVTATTGAFAQISLNFSITEPTCFALPNGSVTAMASGGAGPYSYQWSSGQVGPTLIGITAGTYTVTATDTGGASASATVTVTQPTVVTVSLVADDPCNPPFDITATGGGGISPYDYFWSTGAVTATITDVPPGTYCVTVVDDNSCGVTDCITVTANPPTVTLTKVNVTCPDGSDGSVVAVPSGGVAPFTYLWNTGATTQSLVNIPAGMYTVTLTDASGCTATATTTVSSPPDIMISMLATNPTCPGDLNGSITTTVTGGTPPYTYSWNTGATTPNLFNLGPGTYTLTVTDANNCVATGTVVLVALSNLTVGAFGTAESCPDADDGFLTASSTGGVLPISYLWSNGATTQVVTNVSPGSYMVTITDGVGCVGIATTTVAPAPDLTISVTGTNVSTCEAMDGTATVVVTSGVGPFSYLWSTGATTNSISNLGAGTYTVTVTSPAGCFATGSVTITEPPPVFVVATSANLDCFGVNDGSATANVSGGTAPFSYLWNTSANTPTITNLGPGFYSVTVTDANGCMDQAATNITAPPQLAATISDIDILCFGDNTGIVDLTVVGGTPPFTYIWNTGAITQDLINVTAGTYSVTVTDANGCTATAVTTVTQPPMLQLTGVGTDIDCFGQASGSIAITVAGGTLPYTYAWSNGATTEDLNNLPAGTYSVVVTDANGCTVATAITINEPTALLLTATPTPVDCFGNATGGVDLTVAGGTAPYFYNWSNGSTNQDLQNVVAGTYTVTVTDLNGCTATTTVVVTQPPQLTAVLNGFDILCFGESTGSIDLQVNGGTPPYTYAWSNGATTQDLANLPAGTYTGTITDANGCTATMTITLTQPPALDLTLSSDAVCLGDNSAQLTAVVSGGTAPYAYLWSNGMTTPTLNNLTPGTYSVTVTDANECTTTGTTTVTAFPNPTCAITILQPSTMGNNGSLQVNAMGGTPPYTYLWSNGASTNTISGLAPGTYSVTVTDANGCQTTCMATLEPLAAIGDYVWEDFDLDGLQDMDEPPVSGLTVSLKNAGGTIIANTTTDDNGLYIFTGLAAGTYSVQFELPDGFQYTLSNAGDDTLDSDIIPGMNGMTGQYTLAPGEINLTVDAGIYLGPVPAVADPCGCLNNATNEFNGQFSEHVMIESYPGQTWTIIDQDNIFLESSPAPPAPPIPVPPGIVIPEISPGIYRYDFLLVDELTYYIQFTNGVDTFSFTNTCIYPTLTVNDLPPDSLCVFGDVIDLVGMGNVAGTIEFLLNGEPVTDIDPSTLTLGTYELTATLTPFDMDECIAVIEHQFFLIEECDAKIGDFVWLDDDRDGIQDPDEPGIPGVTVTVTSTDPANPYEDVTETGNDGIYCFNVPPGTYKVTFAPDGNLIPTTPDQGGDDTVDSDMDTVMLMTVPVTVGPDEINLTIDGGFYPKCDNIDSPGLVGFDQMLCGPGADAAPFVEIVPPSGGSGALEYLWMMTTGNPGQDIQFWTPIPNSNTPTYDPGPIFETTYFVRCVRRECCITYLETNILTITVGDDAIAEIDGPVIVCEDDPITFTAVGAGPGAVVGWTFGGSATPMTASGPTAMVTWSTFGVFDVELTVTDNNCTSYAIQTVTVSNSPGACGEGFTIDAEITELATGSVQLSWEMDNIFDGFVYTIEHSDNGVDFAPRGQVDTPWGSLLGRSQYLYEEQMPHRGHNFYRVHVTGNAGLDMYSDIEHLVLGHSSQIAFLYPNPVRDDLTLELLDLQGETAIRLELMDVTGSLLQQQDIEPDALRVQLDMRTRPAGVYLVRLYLGDSTFKTMKVVKE